MILSISDGGEGGGAGGGGAPTGGAPAGGAPAGGAPAGGAPAGGAPAGGAAAPFYETFADEGIRTHASVQRYKTAEELAKGYVNLEARFGVPPERRIDLPADPNDAAAMRAVYSKLGLPEKAEGYALQPGEKATEADKAMLGKWGEFAHKAGMPKAFVQQAVEFWGAEAAAANQAAEQAMTERRTAGEAALKTEFGAAHDTRMGEVERFLQTHDPDGKTGLNKESLTLYPEVVKMIARAVDRMAEPGTPGGGSGDGQRGDAMLTPSQAKAAANKLVTDHSDALQDKNHPQHEWAVKERTRLLHLADGREPPKR